MVMKMFSASTILVLIAATTTTSDAFSFGCTNKQSSTASSSKITQVLLGPYHQQGDANTLSLSSFALKGTASDDDSEPESEPKAAAEGEEEKEEEEEEKEDPEVTAIKEEIKQLESKLKYKKQKIQETKDEADDYTKGGYARKVAQMENMRRSRSMMQSSDKSAASANVISEFLPILDELNVLNEKYESNDFGKQYSGLKSALESSFSRLGVTDYEAVEGEKVDRSRTEIIDSVYSEESAKNTIIEKIASGLELQGNVVRMSKAVVSLGPEPKEEPAATEGGEDEAAATEETLKDAAVPEEETKEE